MVGIHEIHRKLAAITWMNTDKNGCLVIGPAEIMQIIPLLRLNLELIQKLDELKNLALEAQVLGDMVWVQEISEKLEKLEVQMI